MGTMEQQMAYSAGKHGTKTAEVLGSSCIAAACL